MPALPKSNSVPALSGGAGVPVEAAPADLLKAQLREDGCGHVAAPNCEYGHAGAPGDVEARRTQRAVDATTSELWPHRAAGDRGARRGLQADPGASCRLP